MSLLYARLGDADEALSWLEKAIDERAGLVTRAYVHPWFDTLRPHPRFSVLMRTMGLP
jgi:hypothetical protein